MKKIVYNTNLVCNKRTLKFLIMSKCILLLVIISSFQSFSKGFSQDKINVKLNDASLREAFKEIEKKSNYHFLYNDALIKGIKVTVQFTDATINEVMPKLLSDSKLSYELTPNSNLVTITTAQNIAATPIRGRVTDSKGAPLVGVSVREKGTQNATVTDIDGNYRLSVADRASVIEFSYVGYTSIEQTVGSQTTINASLLESASNLNEVVVVGYGTQKRGSVTGAVSSVKGPELAQVPVPNITNSLGGRVTGVLTRQSNGGQPGSNGNSSIQIRGVNTIGNNGNNPLVIVDNVKRDNINQIDPNAIESVTILKDAAATAPYGLGGANGVILITTKQGKTGAPTITLNSYYGIQNPTYLPKVLSAPDYMRLVNEAYYNADPLNTTKAPIKSLSDIANWETLNQTDPDKYPINDPTSFIKKNAPLQNHSVQVSGGSDRVKYYSQLGFFNQGGMYPSIDYTRYSYNLNLEAKVTNTTTFYVSLSGSAEVDRGLDPQHGPTNLLRSTYKYIPTEAFRFTNGLWGASNGLSPEATLRSGGYTRSYYNQQFMTASIEQKLPIKGLSIKGVVNYDPNNWYRKQYHKPFYYYSTDLSKAPSARVFTRAGSTSEGLSNFTYLQEFYDRTQNFTYQGYLNYHNNFGKHDITGLVVAEARNTKNNNFNARINNYQLDVDELNFGSSNKNDYSIGGNSGTSSQVGYVYRVSDTWDNRITVEATGRYDGHYYFAPGKQYAFFPAFSAGWILSNENFMKGVNWLNYLKIRGSWGRTGNLAGNPFQYQEAYTLGNNAYAFNGITVQGSSPGNQSNPYITWEVAEKTDVGFESSLFNGKLNLEVGYFRQRRSNMLFAPQTTVPGEYGTNLSQINIAKMQNEGIEITAGTNHRFANGLQLTLNGNFTYANNKVTQIFESSATFNNPNRRRTDRPWQAQFGYKSLGLFHLSDDKNGDGIINATDGYTVDQFGAILHPGNIKYADLSGPNGVPDGKIDSNDETFIGNNPAPLITYGFTFGANWKGFDLSLFFQGAAKTSIGTNGFLTVPFSNNSSNTTYEYYNNRWTPQNDMGAKYPRASSAPYNNDQQGSDFWVKDGSYLRLRTATLGYTIPSVVVKALKIKSVRLFVTGQNVLTFSKIKFVDPELAGGTGSGTNSDVLWPIQRTWTFGLNATF